MHTSPAQSAVEYGLIVAVLAIVVLLAGHVWGVAVRDWLLALVERITRTST